MQGAWIARWPLFIFEVRLFLNSAKFMILYHCTINSGCQGFLFPPKPVPVWRLLAPTGAVDLVMAFKTHDYRVFRSVITARALGFYMVKMPGLIQIAVQLDWPPA